MILLMTKGINYTKCNVRFPPNKCVFLLRTGHSKQFRTFCPAPFSSRVVDPKVKGFDIKTGSSEGHVGKAVNPKRLS